MSKLSNRTFTVLVVGCMTGFCVTLYGMNHGWFARTLRPIDVASPPTAPRTAGAHVREPKPGWIEVGGVFRPETDVHGTQEKPQAQQRRDIPRYGLAESVTLDDSTPHLKSLSEARGTDTQVDRVSLLSRSKLAYDPLTFSRDRTYREAYLHATVPSRVFSPKAPGENVERIRGIGSRVKQILQGETVSLRVQVMPRAPVTFTTFDSGHFMESKLTSVTVQADEEGIAEANFTAPKGTIGSVNILAASPENSGRVKFIVRVSLQSGPVRVNQNKPTSER